MFVVIPSHDLSSVPLVCMRGHQKRASCSAVVEEDRRTSGVLAAPRGFSRWADVPCLRGQKGGECGPWSRNTKGEQVLTTRSPSDTIPRQRNC